MSPTAPIELSELRADHSQPPLPAQKVATAVESIANSESRRLAWLLHAISHQEGGLVQLAFEMLKRVVPDKLGTPSLRAAGVSLQSIYSGEVYEAICGEIDHHDHRSIDAIKMEMAWNDRDYSKLSADLNPRNRKATGAELIKICRERVLLLPRVLHDFCLSPGRKIHFPYFEGVMDVLWTAIEARRQSARDRVAQTSITSHVADVLRFCHQSKTLGVIEGAERLGKSMGVRLWQECNSDCARLIDLTAGTNDQQFYQEIWKAIGCGESNKGDTGELRLQIRAATQSRDLMLIFDEAHCLFGLSQRASMKRLEYIRTEFVNRGIPVVLVVTPQFTGRIQEMERTTGFNTNQFRGRIMKWARLNPAPNRADIAAVAQLEFPYASNEILELLVSFAASGDLPFARLRRAVLEIRDAQNRSKEPQINIDVVKQALGYSISTSNGIQRSLPQPKSSGRKRGSLAQKHAPEIRVPQSHEAPLKRDTKQPLQHRCTASAPTFPDTRIHQNRSLAETLTV